MTAANPHSSGPTLPPGTTIKRRFRVTDQLGRGAFGEIYGAIDLKHPALADSERAGVHLRREDVPEEALVAIKIEAQVDKEGNAVGRRLMPMEVAILRKMQASPYACMFHSSGKFTLTRPADANSSVPTPVPFDYLVMSRLGSSLSKLRRTLGTPSPAPKLVLPRDLPCTPATGQKPDLTRLLLPHRLAALLCLHTLRAIEAVHRHGEAVHRDVKPGNLCVTAAFETMLSEDPKAALAYSLSGPRHRSSDHADSGLGSSLSLPNPSSSPPPLKIIDFGLARPYLTSTSGTLRPPRSSVGFRGTAAYASVSCHAAKDLGRCDDVWGWFYLAVELVAGWLPWKGLDKQATWAHKVFHQANAEVFLGNAAYVPPQLVRCMEYLDGTDYFSEVDYDRVAAWCVDMATWGDARPGALEVWEPSTAEGGASESLEEAEEVHEVGGGTTMPVTLATGAGNRTSVAFTEAPDLAASVGSPAPVRSRTRTGISGTLASPVLGRGSMQADSTPTTVRLRHTTEAAVRSPPVSPTAHRRRSSVRFSLPDVDLIADGADIAESPVPVFGSTVSVPVFKPSEPKREGESKIGGRFATVDQVEVVTRTGKTDGLGVVGQDVAASYSSRTGTQTVLSRPSRHPSSSTLRWPAVLPPSLPTWASMENEMRPPTAPETNTVRPKPAPLRLPNTYPTLTTHTPATSAVTLTGGSSGTLGASFNGSVGTLLGEGEEQGGLEAGVVVRKVDIVRELRPTPPPTPPPTTRPRVVKVRPRPMSAAV